MAETAARLARVRGILAAAQQLADSERPEGRALRQHLLATSGLSAAGIELAISRCLETEASTEQLQALLDTTPEAPRAHVLLSGNVFVAALRAIAIAAAASSRVLVRASRRDPALAEALLRVMPGAFELTPQLTPEAADHVWAYGADATLTEVRATLPRGVWFHPHGHGIGAVVLDADVWSASDARNVALDCILFDQRGCLSPRLVCVIGSEPQARSIAAELATELARFEQEVPPGPKTPAEMAEMRRAHDAAAYAFELFEAGSGWVSVSSEPVIPNVVRCLHVVPTLDAVSSLAAFSRYLTCVGTNATPLRSELQVAFPGARLVPLGGMQRPPLDGPVDRRGNLRGELVT